MNTHTPVMKKEVLELLANDTLDIVFDGTCGGGGHAQEILRAHPEIKKYIACDRDVYALGRAGEALKEYEGKVEFFHGIFSDPPLGDSFSAVLLDIGVSSFQLDMPERGFSFMRDGPLDMRMDQDQELSAKDIINTWNKEALANLFFEYGEERKSRIIAAAIVERRKKKPFATTLDLADCISQVVPRRGKTHPATLVFQALRIAVNDELGILQRAIMKLGERLAPHGKMIVITFHSLEDRIVKRAFLELSKTEDFSILTKKPLIPSRDEMRTNSRARSSKLRAIGRN